MWMTGCDCLHGGLAHWWFGGVARSRTRHERDGGGQMDLRFVLGWRGFWLRMDGPGRGWVVMRGQQATGEGAGAAGVVGLFGSSRVAPRVGAGREGPGSIS